MEKGILYTIQENFPEEKKIKENSDKCFFLQKCWVELIRQ